MRILMLSGEYPPNMVGGLGKHVNALAPALAEQGVEIHLVTPRDRGGEEFERPNHNVTVHRVTIPQPPVGSLLSDTQAANWELARVGEALAERFHAADCRSVAEHPDDPASEALRARRHGFDLIHAHDWLVAFAAVHLKHLWKVPLVATIHATERGRHQGGLHADLSWAINDVEASLAAEAWRLIVTSYFMAHEMVSCFGVANDKLDVVPNAVNVAHYERPDPEALREFRRRYVSDDQKLVFHVGRIVYEKGLHVLVDAAPEILWHVPNTKFVIAGRGPEVDNLRLQADRLGVGDNFYFTGFVTDRERDWLYQVADVAVFPSLYEPFGIVALEAMAARVPVVVSAVGGLTEVVENHVTGMTAEPGNPRSLAWAICHTLLRPDWAAARCENAYRRVIENFNWERVARQTRDIYARVIEEREHTDW